METSAILEAILAHRLDAGQQHHDVEPVEYWPNLLRVYLDKIFERNWPPVTDAQKDAAGKRALQLAGLCVRMIEEQDLPFITPGDRGIPSANVASPTRRG